MLIEIIYKITVYFRLVDEDILRSSLSIVVSNSTHATTYRDLSINGSGCPYIATEKSNL